MGEKPDYKTVIREKLKQVDISDGVSEEEAILLAQNYMINQKEDFSRNFVLSKPKVVEVNLNDPMFRKLDNTIYKENWVISFPATLEFKLKTGLKWCEMFVNKKTGQVRYSGEGPS